MGFKVKTEDACEKRDLKGRVPEEIAAWFEAQSNETKVPLVDVVGQAIIYAYRTANRKPRAKKAE